MTRHGPRTHQALAQLRRPSNLHAPRGSTASFGMIYVAFCADLAGRCRSNCALLPRQNALVDAFGQRRNGHRPQAKQGELPQSP
jgi:hypothetical protein